MGGPPYGPWGCRWATTPSNSRAASEDPNSAPQVYPASPLPDEPSLHPLTYCVLKIIWNNHLFLCPQLDTKWHSLVSFHFLILWIISLTFEWIVLQSFRLQKWLRYWNLIQKWSLNVKHPEKSISVPVPSPVSSPHLPGIHILKVTSTITSFVNITSTNKPLIKDRILNALLSCKERRLSLL